jgi:hypothetical protein
VIERSVECRLEGVRIDNVELLKHDEACSGFFVLLVGKLAIVEAEQFVFLSQEVGQHFDQVVVLVLIDLGLSADAAVHEDVSFPTVPVHVAEQNHLVLAMVCRDELFSIVNSRMYEPRWVGPPTIQISSNEIASIISNNDTIRIKHGDDLEYKGIPQQLGIFVVLLKQELDGSLNHELGIAFPRMHSRCQEYDLLAIFFRGRTHHFVRAVFLLGFRAAGLIVFSTIFGS